MTKILLFHCQLRRKDISSLSKVCRVTNVRLPGDQVKSMTQSSHELTELTWKNQKQILSSVRKKGVKKFLSKGVTYLGFFSDF